MENPYHPGSLFWLDCAAIYEALQASGRFCGVWRLASGIPHNNGVGFRWQQHRFKIRWQRDHWCLIGEQTLFCTPLRQELIDFCLQFTRLSGN